MNLRRRSGRSDSPSPVFARRPTIADPVAALWQATTTLREHRGDGHVALLTGAGLDGCEAHVLFAAVERVPPELLQQSRGWSAEDWTAAIERLAVSGLVADDGTATNAGRDLRDRIERGTDELAVAPYAPLGDTRLGALLQMLQPAAERIASSGEIDFPNPMGLPRISLSD